MKRYWDTSALIEALESPDVRALSLQPEQWTRSHSLAEMFSTLTRGRKMVVRLSANDAAEVIRDVTGGMKFIDLDVEEVFSALDRAQKKGVKGPHIHDWLHAIAAQKAGVETLFTLNLDDFKPLALGFKVEAP